MTSSQMPPVDAAGVSLLRLDALDANFSSDFDQYRDGILYVLSCSYASYHGNEYHLQRILSGQSIVYLALAQQTTVAVSYVKRNLRRGGTAVYPESYRGRGLAKALVIMSFVDFPEQYSILASSDVKMIRLLMNLGFVRATSIEEVESVTKDEFRLLSAPIVTSEGVTFRRASSTRNTDRETLILLYRSCDASLR